MKVTNFPGSSSHKIVQKLDDLIKDKPDNLVSQFGTSNLTNNVKLLRKLKKILKKVSINTPLPNLSDCQKKWQKNIEKSIAETNPCSKKVCMQKGIGFIDDKKIKEEFLGTKNLNLSQRGNIFLRKFS